MISKITRSIAVEARGTEYRQVRKAGIRLIGHWLREAGFQPGTRCTVRIVAPGLLAVEARP